METNYLEHHGVKGMKWGVRRTPTQLGRRGSKTAKTVAEKKVKAKKTETRKKIIKKPSKSEPKKLKDMTDDELQTAIDNLKKRQNRINMEKEYASLTAAEVNKGKEKTKKVLTKVGNEIVAPVAVDLGKQLLKSYATKALNESLKLEDEYKVHTNNKKK